MNDFPVLFHNGQEVPWIELRMQGALANTDEDIDRNIEANLRRNLDGYQKLLDTGSGAVSIVGSGPSLKLNWMKIKDVGGDIIACNAACQFLLERGIVPKYMFCFDADPLMLEFLTPREDIIYLMASRCPPRAFDILEGCKVYQWHAAGDKNVYELLQKYGRMEPMIAGGSAAVTRAMVLAVPLGYRAIHLWGVDSSFFNGETHIRESTTKEKMMHVLLNQRAFYCAPWMALQAEDFKVLAPVLRDMGIKLIVHGDGLIPHLAKSMNFETDSDTHATRFWREMKEKTGILWSQL